MFFRIARRGAPAAAALLGVLIGLEGFVIALRLLEGGAAEGGVVAMIDEVAKNAPAGSEQAISMFKSAIGNMSAGYEQFTKNAKQAAEVLEANVSNAVDQMSQAGAKVTRAAKK